MVFSQQLLRVFRNSFCGFFAAVFVAFSKQLLWFFTTVFVNILQQFLWSFRDSFCGFSGSVFVILSQATAFVDFLHHILRGDTDNDVVADRGFQCGWDVFNEWG